MEGIERQTSWSMAGAGAKRRLAENAKRLKALRVALAASSVRGGGEKDAGRRKKPHVRGRRKLTDAETA